MPLSFQNLYMETAYVGILWFDADCNPDPWKKIGWYAVAPGETVEVVSGDIAAFKNPNFAWFADTGADGPCWSGDHWYQVPHNAAFSQCYDDESGCNASWPFIAGRLDLNWFGFTIMLLAPGEPNEENQGCAWGSLQYPPPIEITSFRADPDYIRDDTSGTSTLSWEVFSYGVSGATVKLNEILVPFTGSETVSPGNFTLTATTRFSSATKAVTVWSGR